jgi:ABC-type sugar transport system permease subunit
MADKYLTVEEQAIYSEKLHSIIDSLEQELKKVQEKYVETLKIESSKKKPNVKKLNKLEKLELKLKIKIQKNKIDLLHFEKQTYVKLNAFQKLIKRLKTMSFESQEKVGGYVLVLPWLIGFALFFAVPLLMTIYWSFNDVKTIAGGLEISWIGLKNFKDLFQTQMLGTKTFMEVLTNSIGEMIINVPVIFIFSLIVAVVLNTKFKGHQFFKVIFFIPVIYNTTVISLALEGSFGSTMDSTMTGFNTMLTGIQSFLLNVGIGQGLIEFLIAAVDRIFTIVTQSGIQILIFIAALQAIPKHLYEAAKIEGATAYDCFCKITVPMVSKMFLPVLIYSIVDGFASSELINLMTKDSTGAKISYGMASTIAIIYFIVNLIIIGIIYLFLRKAVNNNE